MIISTLNARQGATSTNHAAAKVLVISTTITFVVLGIMANL